MSNTGQISYQLYKWLSSLQIITSNQKYKSSGNMQLDSKLHDDLLSGNLMAKLVETLASQLKIQLNGPLLSSIKKSNTPAARVYNWNILNQSYGKIGVILSKEMQKEITSGNFEELKRFLIDIYHKMLPKKSQKQLNNKQDTQQEIDFSKIQKYKTYEECQTVLDAIVKIISKTCGLTAKQAFATLGQQLKYLSHMIVKGIKNSYDQIQFFYQTIVDNMPHLMYLAQKDPARNTSFLLDIVKPSLISRQPNVALIGSHTLKAIIYESLKYNSKNIIYQILCSQPSGFDFIYMGLKRHPHLASEYIKFLHVLIQHSYKDFFEVHFKNLINNQAEYIKTIIILLDGIKVLDESCKKVIESGLLIQWVKMCEQSFNSIKNNKKQLVAQQQSVSTEQAKILSLELMCDLWKIFSLQLDQASAEQLLMKGIQQLKRNTRKDNYIIKISALNRLFDFLDFLAYNKNSMASIIYKKMIFLLVQNHEDVEMRQIILQNFALVLKKYPTIPLQFLLQPLLKQLITSQGQSYILNVYDFQFFIEVFKHPKMQAAYALNFLEYFTKLYTKNIIYSGLSIRIVQLLASRYCQQEAIMEYIIKNVDSGLNSYGMLAIGKKTYGKNRQQNIMKNQKKSLIIELIKYYIKLQNQIINQAIKSKVLKLYVYWSDTKNYLDKGLESLLTLFGDVQQLIMKERISRQTKKQQSYNNIISSSTNKQRNSPYLQQSRASPPFDKKAFTPISIMNSDSNQSRLHKVGFNKQKNQKLKNLFNNYDSYREESPYRFQSEALTQQNSRKRQQYPNLLQKHPNSDVDPKTLEDIELYRRKYHRQQQRKKQVFQKSIIPEPTKKLNTSQLIQRQLSMGYNKTFATKQLKAQDMMFQFDAVKTKHLKQETQMIDLQKQQDRDIQSTNKILKKYQKQIQAFFYKYTPLGNVINRAPTQQKVFLSFTDLNRMLKQKSLNKLPKIMINQIITYINRKKKYNTNVLVGIQEQQFNQFLILFTNLYLKGERNEKDQPFGYKLQKILFKLFQSQLFAKQLNDKKAQQWFQQNKIFKLSKQQQQHVDIPQGYKRVVNQEVVLNYEIQSYDQFEIPKSYQVCTQYLNQLFKKAIGIDIFPPKIQNKHITRIVPIIKVPKPRIPQALTQKILKRVVQPIDTYSPKQMNKQKRKHSNFLQNIEKVTQKVQKSLTNKRQSLFKISSATRLKSQRQINAKKINKTQLLQQQKQKKKKQQQQYAKKLKDQLQVLRQNKQKKNQDQKAQKQQQLRQKQRKQQKHKKYLQQNRRKIQQKKQKQEEENKLKQLTEKQQKQRKKQQLKNKQKQFLQKQQKKIQEKKQKFEEKVKSQQKKVNKLQNLQKKAKNIISKQNGHQISQQKAKQKRLLQLVSNNNTEQAKILSSYEKQLKYLFQQYWNWKIQKVELKDVAMMMKNFKISPQYISPKILSETFKTLGKGDSLNIQQFKQLLIMYSYKSSKLLQQIQSNNGEEFDPKVLTKFLQDKLSMKTFNYPQTIKYAKMQK